MPDAGTIALLIPIIIFMILIIAILTAHQRKMAEIVHSQKNAGQPGEIEALRREIYELKQLVHQQAIAMDNFVSRQAMPPATPPVDLSQRLDV